MFVHAHVVPSSKKERITKKDATEFRIEVKEPKIRNMANIRVREILASEFGVKIGNVRMLTGHRSPSKMFSIDVE